MDVMGLVCYGCNVVDVMGMVCYVCGGCNGVYTIGEGMMEVLALLFAQVLVSRARVP